MSMTPGQIFWETASCEMGFDPREWSELTCYDQKRFEVGAQAVIAAHVSEREDLIATMAGLLREIVTDPVAADERGVMWVNRAQNALSHVQYAPTDQTPAVDTTKPADAPTGRTGALGRQVGGDHYHQAPMQPWDIIEAYGLDFWEGNVLKYLLRKKPGVIRAQDLAKAIHYLERCIERTAERP